MEGEIDGRARSSLAVEKVDAQVSSLADAQLLELQNWVNDTYHKKYVYEGVVAGYFYDEMGQPTEDHLRFDERVGRAREAAARQALDVEKYPDCASRRTQTERSVSCKKGRVPVRRRTEAGTERCACVLERDEGLGATYELHRERERADVVRARVVGCVVCAPMASSVL